jgi:beta-lactamase class A
MRGKSELMTIGDRVERGGEPEGIARRELLLALGAVPGALMLGLPQPAAASRGTSLQTLVNRQVKRLRAQGIIRSDEETSWPVYDFTTGKKLVAINEDIPRQAASMVKPFVAQALFYTAARRGSGLSYTSAHRALMEQMIRRSSNTATNRLIDIVSRYNGSAGPKAVERVLKANAPGIFRQTSIVERIPAGGRTYRNKASAHDYSRFLFALWNDRMPFADELREIMALPNRDRITHGVSNIPAHVRVYDKTGSTARLCGNMGIIECRDSRGRPRPYTFIGIIEKRSRTGAYGTWITKRSNAIRSVSRVVYDYMKQRHRLA